MEETIPKYFLLFCRSVTGSMAGGGATASLNSNSRSEQLRCNSWKWKTFAPLSVSASFLPAEAKPYSDFSPENSCSDSRQRWDLVISVNTLVPCSRGHVAGRHVVSATSLWNLRPGIVGPSWILPSSSDSSQWRATQTHHPIVCWGRSGCI